MAEFLPESSLAKFARHTGWLLGGRVWMKDMDANTVTFPLAWTFIRTKMMTGSKIENVMY